MHKLNDNSRVRGFTLVEIMIVVAIIGLLSVLGLPSLVRARTTAAKQKCILNQRTIYDSVIRYEMDYCTTLYSIRSDGVAIRQALLDDGYMNPDKNFDCPNSQVKDYDDYQLTYTNGQDLVGTRCTILPAQHVLQF